MQEDDLLCLLRSFLQYWKMLAPGRIVRIWPWLGESSRMPSGPGLRHGQCRGTKYSQFSSLRDLSPSLPSLDRLNLDLRSGEEENSKEQEFSTGRFRAVANTLSGTNQCNSRHVCPSGPSCEFLFFRPQRIPVKRNVVNVRRSLGVLCYIEHQQMIECFNEGTLRVPGNEDFDHWQGKYYY